MKFYVVYVNKNDAYNEQIKLNSSHSSLEAALVELERRLEDNPGKRFELLVRIA